MADKEKPEMVLKFKREDPEQFHCLVKMHLSFLLDMNTDECDCSFLFDHLYPGDHGTPKRKGSLLQSSKGTGITNKKGIMEGATLTMEGVCQIFQIIQFLDRTNNIEQIGLFRKTGNLQKQKVLKERLNRGVPMDLDQGEFSVHECASVLKTFLSELPEPLLTDRFFHAHCQVANKIIKYFAPNHSAESSDCNDTLSYDERTKLFKETDDFRRCVESLQLLFLLIPDANYNLLKDMLKFLRRITHHQEKNKMSASNLGTIFATHLMCPRKLSAESLQSNHQLYSSAVTFMIQQSDILFNIPEKVVQDVLAHRKRTSDKGNSSILRHVSGDRNVQSPIVNTIFSFVDRQRSKEDSNELTTDTAIAQLYAQVQAMPESAQKKRLIAKLNDNKGFSCNTSTLPIRYRNTSNSVNGTFEHLKNFLTPRFSRRNTSMTENKNIFGEKKSAHSGSYNIQHSDKVANNFEKHTPLNSYTPIRDGIDGTKKNELQLHEIPDIVKPKILDEPNDIASKLSRSLKTIIRRTIKPTKITNTTELMTSDPHQNWILIQLLSSSHDNKIYMARSHTNFSKIVAIKVCKVQEESDYGQLMKEINILSNVSHPNITQMYESYYFENQIWMVLEFCKSGSLDVIMAKRGKAFNEEQVSYICGEICQALIYLHKNLIIHRDLKASNVLIDDEGAVKLADFGVSSRLKDDYEKKNTFIGTPYWMAPEVIICDTQNNAYDSKADIWSFGILMIELAQMNPPHSHINPQRVLLKILRGVPPSLESPSNWSSDFNDIIKMCLTKDAEMRPSIEQVHLHNFLKKSINKQMFYKILLDQM